MCGGICTSVRSTSSRLSTDGALLFRCSRVIFCCLPPWRGPTSPSSRDSIGLFFFRSGFAFRLRSAGTCGAIGGRTEGWDLAGAFNDYPLPRVAISSRKLFPLLEVMLSTSSSEESFEQAIIRGASTTKFLSCSPSTSESLIRGAFGMSSLK